MTLSEDQVYLGTKKWLIANGYVVLAGQPARGTDQLPVIEIKLPTGNKGSRYSYKPDLFAYKDGVFYIIECKPLFNHSDCEKIWGVLDNPERIRALYEEAKQYHLFDKVGYTGDCSDFANGLKGIVAYGPPPHHQDNIIHIVVETWLGDAVIYY